MDLNEFKKFLGPIAKEYTDAQLKQLRQEMYAWAILLLEVYLEHKKQRGKNE